jgi:hypothetical protein
VIQLALHIRVQKGVVALVYVCVRVLNEWE